MKKILFILICAIMMFSISGCSGNNQDLKSNENIVEEEKEVVKEKIKKLTQNDDVLSYLTTYNNFVYYEPVVMGMSNSSYKTADVRPHLLYFDDKYIYDINPKVLDNNADANFENIPDGIKEKNKYEISEVKLQSNDEEIYLKAVKTDDSGDEYHLFFQYYNEGSNSLSIYIGRPNRYYVYDYYYDEDIALGVAKSSVETSESKTKPMIGMDVSQVRATKWGSPDKINKDTYSWGTIEQWVYDDYGYVYFKNGVVTGVSER